VPKREDLDPKRILLELTGAETGKIKVPKKVPKCPTSKNFGIMRNLSLFIYSKPEVSV
jgi:hypothetical protein